MSAATQRVSVSDAVAELVEQRARLENRLAEFHRVAAQLARSPLPSAANAALADLNAAVARFDADLTLLANIVHDVVESQVALGTAARSVPLSATPTSIPPETLGAPASSPAALSLPEVFISHLVFVRAAGCDFALLVDDVREIRSWQGSPRSTAWREREVSVVPLAAALQLPTVASAPSQTVAKLIVLDAPPQTALLVDEIARQDELVIRPLGPLVSGPFRGAVVGLNEKPVLVLNPAALISRIKK